MNRFIKKIICLALVMALAAGVFCPTMAFAETPSLTAEQVNAIAMLNYITVLTQEINASKNSRLYLEDAYSTLINNTYPNAVDSRTLSQLTGLLDTMEDYRLVDVQRDRLEFLYEQKQAELIRSLIPDPRHVLTVVLSKPPIELAATIANTAIDAYSSYSAASEGLALDYLQDGWALDDTESAILHESRKGTFTYMVSMVSDYDLPGELKKKKKTVEEFVKWKNSGNNTGRIQFLESNQETYQSFGGYWLALANSYYLNGDYKKCLNAVQTYEDLGTHIFRCDYELAKILPAAIASAEKTLSKEDYIAYASEKVQEILDNTSHDDWALRYFAAQTLVNLYGKSNKKTYLKDAYSIILDNVNYLISKQQTMNEKYLSKVKEVSVPKGASKREKTVIQNYNKMLKEERKRELVPVYEPLTLNCDLLLSLAEKLNISSAERKKLDAILHPGNEHLFLADTLDAQYWFQKTTDSKTSENMEIAFGGTVLILPVSFITRDVSIAVTVTEPGAKQPFALTDWTLDKVQRGKEGDLSSFEAAYVSKEAKKHTWLPDSKVSIEIQPSNEFDLSYHYEFKTVGTKNGWKDYLQVWKGHKNNWYDYAKVWENSVNFVPVT